MDILNKCSRLLIEICKFFSNVLVSFSKRIITGSHFLSTLQISKDFIKRRQREIPWYRDQGDERYLLDYQLNSKSLVVEVGGASWIFFLKYCVQVRMPTCNI